MVVWQRGINTCIRLRQITRDFLDGYRRQKGYFRGDSQLFGERFQFLTVRVLRADDLQPQLRQVFAQLSNRANGGFQPVARGDGSGVNEDKAIRVGLLPRVTSAFEDFLIRRILNDADFAGCNAAVDQSVFEITVGSEHSVSNSGGKFFLKLQHANWWIVHIAPELGRPELRHRVVNIEDQARSQQPW